MSRLINLKTYIFCPICCIFRLSVVASWKVLTKEASKTVRSHHVKFPDCGILNLTSLAQCVAFCASQKPQNLRTLSWKVLTKDASQTVGPRKFGSRKDGCLKLRMSCLINIEPYIFAKQVAFCAYQKPQDNRKSQSWKLQRRLSQSRNVQI